ncbi:Uncharacterized protein APZ42_002860, partial [Daphnia magna]
VAVVELVIARDPILQLVGGVARHAEVADLLAILLCVVVVLIPVRAHAHLVRDHGHKNMCEQKSGKTKQKF